MFRLQPPRHIPTLPDSDYDAQSMPWIMSRVDPKAVFCVVDRAWGDLFAYAAASF